MDIIVGEKGGKRKNAQIYDGRGLQLKTWPQAPWTRVQDQSCWIWREMAAMHPNHYSQLPRCQTQHRQMIPISCAFEPGQAKLLVEEHEVTTLLCFLLQLQYSLWVEITLPSWLNRHTFDRCRNSCKA